VETIYRAATADDLPQCLDVFAESIGDLCARQNRPPPGPVNPFRVAVHNHLLSTAIYHVAEQGGRIVAFACAIVRGRTWFLANFWARPALQKQHIGMQLLRGVWKAGLDAGAEVWFVWASSDPPALSAYMKIGMLPGCQIMAFEGRPTAQASAGYSSEPLERQTAMRLDGVTRGAARETDHAFFEQVGWKGMQVLHRGGVAGYYYIQEDGSVGPAAWSHPRHAQAVLAAACAGRERVSLEVPGMNHDALRFAFASGLRFTQHAHLLMNEKFGRLDRYIPSGAYLF
jgi:hypothetical protein